MRRSDSEDTGGSFEVLRESLALLEILAIGKQDIEAGRVKPVADVVADLREARNGRNMGPPSH